MLMSIHADFVFRSHAIRVLAEGLPRKEILRLPFPSWSSSHSRTKKIQRAERSIVLRRSCLLALLLKTLTKRLRMSRRLHHLAHLGLRRTLSRHLHGRLLRRHYRHGRRQTSHLHAAWLRYRLWRGFLAHACVLEHVCPSAARATVAVLEVLAKVIGPEELLGLVAFAELVNVVEVLDTRVPVWRVGKVLSAVPAGVGGCGRRVGWRVRRRRSSVSSRGSGQRRV